MCAPLNSGCSFQTNSSAVTTFMASWAIETGPTKLIASPARVRSKRTFIVFLQFWTGRLTTCFDQATAESLLQWWCSWASRSRLEPFRTLAKTVRQHWQGILAYFDTGLTSATIEAVNGIIQLAKRIARGFKNFIYFRTAAYLRAGCLRFELPAIN